MNLPNKITISRIILTILLIATLIVLDYVPNFDPGHLGQGVTVTGIISLVIFLIASLTDALDGYLARKWHQVTDLGKFLDPIADKMLVNSFLIYFCVPHFGTGLTIPIFCVILMIVRDLVVDALRFVAASKGAVVAANIFGKLKTVFQMVSLPFFFLNGWPFSYFDADWGYGRITYILMYITTAMSVISGIIYVVQNRHVIKEVK